MPCVEAVLRSGISRSASPACHGTPGCPAAASRSPIRSGVHSDCLPRLPSVPPRSCSPESGPGCHPCSRHTLWACAANSLPGRCRRRPGPATARYRIVEAVIERPTVQIQAAARFGVLAPGAIQARAVTPHIAAGLIAGGEVMTAYTSTGRRSPRRPTSSSGNVKADAVATGRRIKNSRQGDGGKTAAGSRLPGRAGGGAALAMLTAAGCAASRRSFRARPGAASAGRRSAGRWRRRPSRTRHGRSWRPIRWR